MKRTSSEAGLSGLVAKPSPYSSSVTLFEASDFSTTYASYSAESPRRSKRVKSVVEVKKEIEDIEEAVAGPSRPARGSVPRTPKVEHEDRDLKIAISTPSPKKNKPIQMVLDKPHPAPPNWRETYDKIKEMRQMYVAAVDTMGCAQAQLRETDPKSQRLSTLVSLMLSSQTKDEVTDAAVSKLRKALGGKITLEGLLGVDESTISESIAKVGFWRRKTQYIKQAATRLRDDFNSDVPKTVDELCSLPGVGPKMAFLCLQSAWNINDGIGVDVHVHRISNRLQWHNPSTKTPEETRLNLQSWLPKELHPEINHLLVGFGQTICLPVGPRCEDCLLSSGLCPSAKVQKVSKTRKALQIRTAVVKEEIKEEIKEEKKEGAIF